MQLDSSFYNYEYFETGNRSNYGGPGYVRAPEDQARANVIALFNPKKTLDMGCAKGYTVEHLRKKGIDAHGFDISYYAQDSAPEEIKDCFKVGDATKGLPYGDKEFDVVYSYDFLEHIPGEHIPFVISELRRVGKLNYHRIATLTGAADHDKSHVSIHPIEWWRERFPDAILAGSEDPDDYDLKTQQPVLSPQLTQYLNENRVRLGLGA